MKVVMLCNSYYRRGRTRHGESEVKLPPEMELSNQILVTSKEGGVGESASREVEEDAEEVEVAAESRNHRLLDRKLFQRLKKHPKLAGRLRKKEEEEEEENNISALLSSSTDNDEDLVSTVSSANRPGANRPGKPVSTEAVTETSHELGTGYYHGAQSEFTTAGLQVTTNLLSSEAKPRAPVKLLTSEHDKHVLHVVKHLAKPERETK